MSDWRDQFTQYTTGFAFNLSLSRDQASLLEAIGGGEWEGWASHTGRGSFIPTIKALQRRGLAEHNPAVHAENRPANSTPKWFYRLTPAGQHVLELLRLTGVAQRVTAVATEVAA
ncbi:PadR family transcriptional regulator [Devosia sp. SL43]|uniref:PadR family transcriptional regulator n=1 Tax=Devosia sp. SL43 TaxID=2806348 RepID=UPI001F2F533E|nr:PadR family transcriptional regulator [Devosia sp. SL43]UJW87919.1 hypothetical protein IM737_20775 [Devosia sp. SL43]